jgi:hypothetical protein
MSKDPEKAVTAGVSAAFPHESSTPRTYGWFSVPPPTAKRWRDVEGRGGFGRLVVWRV